MKSLALVFLILTLFSVVAIAADQPAPPAEGTPAPTFTLPNQEGAQVSLDQFKGRWVVLYFYPKDMTQGCTIEAHNFQRDLDKYTAKKAAIVGVSADNIDSHQQFCTKESLTFKLLADPEKKVIAAYGSVMAANPNFANRNTFLIDPNGVIRKVYVNVNANE